MSLTLRLASQMMALLMEGAAPSAPEIFAAATERRPPGFLERVEVNAPHLRVSRRSA